MQNPEAERIATTWVRKILIPTDAGSTYPTMVPCGRQLFPSDGHRTAPAAGSGSPTGVGPGFRTSRGAGLPIIMAAGFFTAVHGSGGRGRYMPNLTIVLCGRRHTFLSSDSAEAAGSASASDQWDGCRSGRVIRSSPGMDAIVRVSTR